MNDASVPPPADPPTAPAHQRFVVLNRALAAVHAHTRVDIEAHGLTVGEFAILEALYHKGPLLLGDLQRRILV